MTASTKRKTAPAKSNVVKLPRPRKPRLTPAKVEAATPPATRPIMLIASTQKVELERQGREALDETSMLDAVQAKADAAYKAAKDCLDTERDERIAAIDKAHANKVAILTGNHEEETKGRAALRAEYVEIAARCHAALTVDDSAIASYRQGLGVGVGQ